MTKHFFKVLTIFIFMIILGLVGVFLVTHFDKDGKLTNMLLNKIPIAK